MPENYMTYIWLALLIVFGITEAATAQLTTIWFSVGALVALLLSAFGVDNIPLQIVVFVLVSLAALILTRPLVKKFVNKKKQPTNADRYIGETAIVTQEINNLAGTGLVKVKGAIWTARSQNDSIIQIGTCVTVSSIEGVKLIVENNK